MAREMKDSGIQWVGDIPTGWKMTKINRICSTITDYVASGSFASLAENVKYLDEPDYAMLIRTVDVSGKGHSEKPVYINQHAYEFLSNSNLFGGEIMLPNIGASVGDVHIVPQLYEKMSLAPNSIMIRTTECDKFVYYYFCSDAGKKSILDIAQSTAQPKFNKTDFKQLRITIPSKDEQRNIVNVLDHTCAKIDVVIATTKATIEEYKKLKQSVITDAVTKGVRGDRGMKDSGSVWFGRIPSDWDMRKIKYLFRIKKNIAGEEGYTVLSITQRGIVPKDISKNEGQLAESYANYQLVDPGDFAMNHMDLLTGWVDVSSYSGVTSPDYRVFSLIDSKNNCRQYYLYLMQMCYTNRIFYGLGQGVSGLGRWRLQADKFLNFSITVPSYKEQKEIANYLDQKCSAIDELIAKKEQYLSEIGNYKKSLIYEYVTGKKEVPQKYKA